MNNSRLLLIFVKNLKKGKVKTRLAESTGDAKALRIYKELLDYTRKVSRSLEVSKQVWYAWDIPDNDAWDTRQFKKRLQRGDDLGERMHYAFRQAFRDGYDRVAIIGSDCAELTTGILEEAYRKLDNSDVVIGPSADGGYYLMGMNAFYPQLFEDIDWSTPAVLTQTVSRASQLGLTCSLLPELNDVDTEEDWKSVKDKL